MKLAINGRFLLQDVTGVQRVAIEFVRALDTLQSQGRYPNLEITIFVPRAGDLVSTVEFERLKIRRVGYLSGHAWEQIELPVLAGKSNLLCLGNTAPILRLLSRRTPTYTLVHDLSFAYFPSAYSRPFRLLYKTVLPLALARSNHAFTVSVSEERSIREHYPRIVGNRPLTAIQNGGGEQALGVKPSHDASSARAGTPNEVPAIATRPPLILYVGSLTRRKNGPGLLQAAIKLVNSLDVEFAIVGATNSSFEEVGLEVPGHARERIRFLGQVNERERIEELYRRARVFVFPSFYEASPLPPIEAMSFGAPVVCSDIPSLHERCGEAAVYVDPHDTDAIVREVRKLLEDELLSNELQCRGLIQASKFLWRNQVEAMLQVLLENP